VNQRRTWTIPAVRWAARLWAIALFLLWGAFFVEHTAEWFSRGMRPPPERVVALHALHALFLVGLLVGWRWEILGGVLTLVAGTAFFMKAGGANGPLFSLISVLPAVAWLGLAIAERRQASASTIAGT